MAAPAKKDTPTIITDPKASSVMTMKASEYEEWSKKQGKVFGRDPNQFTPITEEKLRILIKTGWTRAMVKEHFGYDDKKLDELLVRMSHKERLDKVQVLR